MTDERETKHHNVQEILDTIKATAATVIELKAERAAIQEQITEAKATVKAKGIKMADFNAALRLYELEQEDRNEALTNLKLCFEALQIGAQGDLFPSDAQQAAA